jgi:hypothetical protein
LKVEDAGFHVGHGGTTPESSASISSGWYRYTESFDVGPRRTWSFSAIQSPVAIDVGSRPAETLFDTTADFDWAADE